MTMTELQNLHTHTTFCDGKDTPEEIILEALDKGFSHIGFSIHSYMWFSNLARMTPQSMIDYKAEVNTLKEKYAGQIGVFCGIEAEMLSENDWSGYDYIIGSSHYFKIDGDYVGFDRNAQTVENVINNYFGGDGLKYAKMYYENLSQLPSYVNADILGHFDLISKHRKMNFFDENSKEYLKCAFDAIDALSGKIPFFEVNTGAIARGYRETPYPSVPLTKRLLEKGFLPVISSDCHDKHYLDCAFELAADLLEECGAKERYILTENGFKAVKLR